MGSRILSRSFDVEKDEDQPEEDADDETDEVAANTSLGSAMDVDLPQEETESAHGDSEHTDGDEDAEDEEEEPSGVSMVPLADMLNARYDSENVRVFFITLGNNRPNLILNQQQAKLFHEKDDLRMVSTKPIKAGEQIVRRRISPVNDTDNIHLIHSIGSGTLTATYPTPSYCAVTATSTWCLCQMESSAILAM
jgi:SET domain-containing protein 6